MIVRITIRASGHSGVGAGAIEGKRIFWEWE